MDQKFLEYVLTLDAYITQLLLHDFSFQNPIARIGLYRAGCALSNNHEKLTSKRDTEENKYTEENGPYTEEDKNDIVYFLDSALNTLLNTLLKYKQDNKYAMLYGSALCIGLDRLNDASLFQKHALNAAPNDIAVLYLTAYMRIVHFEQFNAGYNILTYLLSKSLLDDPHTKFIRSLCLESDTSEPAKKLAFKLALKIIDNKELRERTDFN